MKKTLLFVCALLMSFAGFAQTPIDFDQHGNVELSQFGSFAEDDIFTIEVTITNADGVGAGWGIGKITDIAYAKDNTSFQYALSAKEVSETGVINKYDFTIAQIKEFASIDPGDLETLKTASGKVFGTDWTVGSDNYIVDQYDRSGIVVNVWGAATRTAMYVTEGSGQPAAEKIVFDFENNEIGATYAAAGDGTAMVVANPAATAKNSKSLSYQNTDYDQIITIGMVQLSAGYTLADCESLSFDVYTEAAQYKELIVKIGDDPLWGNGIYKKICNGASWSTLSINLTTGVTTDATGAETSKSGEKGGTSVYTDGTLTSFTLALGVNDNAIAYYLDNITLTLANKVGIVNVTPELSKVRNVEGGIVVPGNAKVSVYSIDGRLVKQAIGGNQTISLERGLYIVKAGAEKAVKVLVK